MNTLYPSNINHVIYLLDFLLLKFNIIKYKKKNHMFIDVSSAIMKSSKKKMIELMIFGYYLFSWLNYFGQWLIVHSYFKTVVKTFLRSTAFIKRSLVIDKWFCFLFMRTLLEDFLHLINISTFKLFFLTRW